MPRRLWLSLALLAMGVGLLATSRLAGASASKGGILRVGIADRPVLMDPQLADYSTNWWIEYATAAKLFNFPDKRGPGGSIPEPEVASSFAVARDGRVYTFRIREGFRFSDGSRVTADSFSYAIDRVANHDLASPGQRFIVDPGGTNIVGAAEVARGYGRHVRGVVAKGDRLVIRLIKPDAAFISKLTMPYFQATSRKLPLSRRNVTPYPSAGPYAFIASGSDFSVSIRRNRYWKPGPGRHRPRNLAGVDYDWSQGQYAFFQQVEANQLDETIVPGDEAQYTAKKYRVNKARFWVEPQACTDWISLNMSGRLFKNNLPLRQAVNYAINRRAYVAIAGPYSGRPWTHILNPGVPGRRDVTIYKHDVRKARRLAKGHLRGGNITVYYHDVALGQAQALVVRQNLTKLGFRLKNITMKGVLDDFYPDGYFSSRKTDMDLAVQTGWCAQYPDPYDFINFHFDGQMIRAGTNPNNSLMALPKWNRRMEAAARLVGPRRFKVYGQLDLDLMRWVAPVAVEQTYNNRYLFSKRVDPRSLVYQGIYQDWSIPALRLK